MTQKVEKKSLNFWEEICGIIRFRDLGLKEISPESLKIFDSWYMEYYPYLYNYLPLDQLKNISVLEIGLGCGTIGEKLFMSAKKYIGLDYSKNPVDLMNLRIKFCRKENQAKAVRGDAKFLPFDKEIFDLVVSIGCLHHTGDAYQSVQEIWRVLKNGGKAIIMVYNKNSFRRIFKIPPQYIFTKYIFKKHSFRDYNEFIRSRYDCNSKGEAAPVTNFLSKKETKKIFSKFKKISIKKERFDDLYFPGTQIGIPRKMLLNNMGRIMGNDLYITAIK